MALINSDVIPASATAYEIEQSLRFNDDDTAYLSWTPSSAGNRKTWTWSGWVKRGNLGSTTPFLGYGVPGTLDYFGFNSSNQLFYFCVDGGGVTQRGNYNTTAVFRDTSAWYHIVFAVDTTQATSTNRLKVYVNGVQQALTVTTAFAQNWDTYINSNVQNNIGYTFDGGNSYFDGYLSEVNFIDGQALDPTYFGETGDYGEWKPIEYTGTYGTNGFYLPFKNDYQVEGFSTTLYTGTGTTQYIGGVGFNPDWTWIKGRSTAYNHMLFDEVRGVSRYLQSSTTNAEGYSAGNYLSSFDSDGFTLQGQTAVNNSGTTYVAWSWDMGGSNATNTDGSITSTVRANPTYGQSIVSYVGNQTQGATVGHGLSSAPELIIIKNRDLVSSWAIYHTSLGANNYLRFDTAGTYSSSTRYPSVPSSTVFTIGNDSSINGDTANDDLVAYCFHSVSGYSKIGSYTGTGSSGNTITTGFKPAFVIAKNTTGANNWVTVDAVRGGVNEGAHPLRPNLSDAEGGGVFATFSDTGFTIITGDNDINASGGTYIYMAFADTREFAYWLDQSGNNNDWTSNNLTESDISVDSPTNNFATLNAIDSASSSTGTLSEGNLLVAGADYIRRKATFYFGNGGISSGKWYWEIQNINGSRCNYCGVIGNLIEDGGENLFGTDKSWVRTDLGYKNYTSSSSISLGLSHTSGDILGFALDMDAGTLAFYQNNSLIHTDSTIDTNVLLVPFVTTTFDGAGGTAWSDNIFNFGQDSSFAGTKTAQGNTDSNSIGDFYYTPPSGYLALCTANLPDPAVTPSEHFNTVLYTGNSSTQSITGVGFQPDFVWAKSRNIAQNHTLFNVIQGVHNYLFSNSSSAETTNSSTLTSFDSDGYTMGSGFTNESGYTYVGWNWKANGSGVSNTNGSITSTVSANQDAGFSIVSDTGTGNDHTIGHGLGSAPEMIIRKNRDTARNWLVWHKDLTDGYALEGLNTTGAEVSGGSPSKYIRSVGSTTFTVGNDVSVNENTNNYISYCFHSVDGFSKVGSYTGNGSTDGTFVYTGFRPAFIMMKRTDSANYWMILDDARESDNPLIAGLYPNNSDAETNFGNSTGIDYLSNGFKHRDNVGSTNASGGTYIYIAFAENPFKYTNAR